MTIQHLTTETAVKELAWNILDISATGNPGGNLFLFGAGASYSCGIPLATEIAKDLETELRSRGRWKEPHASQPDMNPYEWAMHQLTKYEQINRIRGYIERARAADSRWKLNHCYMVLAEIWKTYSNYSRTLLTTNFDPLFYYAMLELNIEPKIIRHVAEMDLMDPFDTAAFPAIIYLHGYWQNHFILNTVAEWESFRRDWVSRLPRDIKNHGLVVIGYSGFQHDIVMQTLLHIQRATLTQLAGPVYWCHKGEISHETYASLQGMSDVRLVSISSADSFMLRLGQELELPAVKKIVAFARVLGSLPPGFVLEFQNHARIQIKDCGMATAASDAGVSITIETHEKYGRPGENYAGFDIYSTQRLFDI